METLKLDARLRTLEPAVEIDPGLPPGRYRVTLVATSARGDSLPAEMLLTVVEPRILRTPIITPAPRVPLTPLEPLVAPKTRGGGTARPRKRRPPK
ncbi:MAG TPA: hypothetical protein VF104_02665 [Burkholderiales bacterium]